MKTLVTMRIQRTIDAADDMEHDVFMTALQGHLEAAGWSVDVEDETPLDEEE